MPTLSKIKESSFRIGAGRYIQESGAIARLGDEVLRLHAKHPLIIGGKTALSLAKEKAEESLRAKGLCADFAEYTLFCCRAACRTIAEEHATCDIVVGVGGGNIMDAAKELAAMLDTPVINIPTSSATCAAYTPLSVCYTEEGKKDSSSHHKKEVDCVLADMDFLCKQPVRLLLAGIYDSVAKIYELEQRMLGVSEEENDIGLLSSYHLSAFAADFIQRNTDACLRDIAEKKNTKTVFDMMYILIALTGVISGLARGSNQCAIAHAVYESARTLYPKEVYGALHGELVGIGLIVQIAYNGKEDVAAFANQMKHYGMPTSLTEVGVSDPSAYTAFTEMILSSSAMAGTNEEERAHFLEAFRRIL